MEQENPEIVLIGHGNAITSLAFSRDGKTLVSASYDHTAIVWDVETGTMRRLLELRELANGIAITPDDSIVITDDGQVWDALTGLRLRRSIRYMAPLACSPDGRTLACATFVQDSENAIVLLIDIRTGRTRHRFECCEHQPRSLAFSTDGLLVAACGYDSREDEESPYVTTVCNLKTRVTRPVLHGKDVFLFGANLAASVRLVAVSPDGTQLWNAETGVAIKNVAEPDEMSHLRCESVSLSPNGRLLAVGTHEGDVTVWDVDTRELLWQTAAHRGWLRAVAFTSNGATLATGGDDHTIRLWDSITGMPHATLGRQRESVEAVAFSQDGHTITTISENGTARLWRISPPRCERREVHPSGVLALGAPRNPDTARNLWNIGASTLPTNTEVPNGFSIAAISPDGSLIAMNLPAGYISIWNRVTRKLQSTMQNAQVCWGTPSFSPDNRYLVTGDVNGLRVCVFDIGNGEISKELATDNETVEFAFSSDVRLLAVGHVGFSVTLWNVRTGKRKRLMHIDRDSVSALAFAPDGKSLAVGTDYEATVWLKSLTRGRKNIRLEGHTDNIRSIDFSPDGTRIATGAQDGSVRLWEPDSGKLLATYLALPEEEWVVYTSDGDYTRSPGSEQWILTLDGKDLNPVARYKRGEEIG